MFSRISSIIGLEFMGFGATQQSITISLSHQHPMPICLVFDQVTSFTADCVKAALVLMLFHIKTAMFWLVGG